MFLLFDSPEGGPALDSDAILESSGGSFQAGLTFYLMGMGQLYERTMQHRKAKAIEALRDQINLWNEPHDLEFLRMLSDLTAPHANPRPPFRDFAAVKEHRARTAVYATVRRDIPQLWRIFHPEIEVQL